ncbi:MAG: EpsI family protein [Fibrobacteres bacterium]|nr:EpsI family protein [Fibrobacterota bacterium]
MTRNARWVWTLAALLLLGISAGLSNLVLFRQSLQGVTQLTRNIPNTIGSWQLVEERQASAGEIKGLETSDIIERTYSNGQNYMELIVAYIAHSSRKSAHAQEACLRGAGALVGSIGDTELDGKRVAAKLISIDIRDHRQWVCYWYKIGNTYTAKYLQSSLLMFLGGLVGEKHQGASLVRLLTPEGRGETQQQIQVRIEDFTHFLLPELEKNLP